MEDANPNSTTFPAKRRRVQWSWPSGAGRQANAIRWASPRSSNFRCRLAWLPVPQGPSQPLLGKSLLDPVYGAQRHIQGFRHLGSRSTVVALEQNPRPGGHPGRAFPYPNQMLQFLPLFRRQPHRVLITNHHCYPHRQHFIPGRIAWLSVFLNNC